MCKSISVNILHLTMSDVTAALIFDALNFLMIEALGGGIASLRIEPQVKAMDR